MAVLTRCLFFYSLLAVSLSNLMQLCLAAPVSSQDPVEHGWLSSTSVATLCVLLVAMPLFAVTLLCCRGTRKSRGFELTHTSQQCCTKEHDSGINTLDKAEKEQLQEEGLVIPNDNFVSASHSYFESLDHKLDGMTEKPWSTTQKTSKQRSLRASFKLPVSPEEPQGKSNPIIPVPKLVARPRPKGKQLSLDFELGKVQEAHMNTQHENNSGSNSPPMETYHLSPAEKAAASKPPLMHARSLDDLLKGDTPVTVELTQNKKAKYSKVVITASTYTLNEEPQYEEVMEDGQHAEMPVHLATEYLTMGECDSHHTSAQDCTQEPESYSDASSVTSFILTSEMLADSSSEKEQDGTVGEEAENEVNTANSSDKNEDKDMEIERQDILNAGKGEVDEISNDSEGSEETNGTKKGDVEATEDPSCDEIVGQFVRRDSQGNPDSPAHDTSESDHIFVSWNEAAQIEEIPATIEVPPPMCTTHTAEEDPAEKVKMTPIPTPPPSPPKTKMAPIPTPPPSPPNTKMATPPPSPSKANSRPPSKVEDLDSETRSTSPPFESASSPAVRNSPSPPLSPKSEEASVDIVGESLLDTGVRLSPVVPEEAIPVDEAASKTETTEESKTGTGVEYSVVQKPKRKKKRGRKSSHDQPIMSPPHTPPPLPPPLLALLNEECKIGKKMEECKITEDDVCFVETGVEDDTTTAVVTEKDTSDLGLTCIRCGKCLAPRQAGVSASSTTDLEEPIYQILEKPLCDSCQRSEYRVEESLQCPPLPSRDIIPTTSKKTPLYERVASFKRPQEPADYECAQECRRTTPQSLQMKDDDDSNPDYETLSPLERPPSIAYLKGKAISTSSDYESITSLDVGSRARRNETAVYANIASNNSSHDYESIDNLAIVPNMDSDMIESPPYIPDGATRNKLLKVDSQGYASVLYPHEEDEDDSWEFDCLNQETYRQQESKLSVSSNVTVLNVEEAWRHQLEKGYAPLTMQQEPPPLFSRTRSAPNTALASARRDQPQDYEVPRHLMMPPPPPPMIALRRISLMKQQQAAAEGYLSDVQEEEGVAGITNGTATPPDKESSGESSTSSAQASSLENTHAHFRSRIMTAPTLTFQTFAVAK